MHFLCLHGLGTNSQILEAQTAALRYELGDCIHMIMPKEQFHTPWTLVGSGPYTYYNLAGVATYFRTTDGGFAYFDPEKPETFSAALSNLQDFIEHEGPFDAVIIVPTGLYQGKDSY